MALTGVGGVWMRRRCGVLKSVPWGLDARERAPKWSCDGAA